MVLSGGTATVGRVDDRTVSSVDRDRPDRSHGSGFTAYVREQSDHANQNESGPRESGVDSFMDQDWLASSLGLLLRRALWSGRVGLTDGELVAVLKSSSTATTTWVEQTINRWHTAIYGSKDHSTHG